MDEIISKVRGQVLRELDLTREVPDEEIEDLIARIVSQECREHPISLSQRIYLEKAVFNGLRKLDVLQELVDNPEITEIMVNGHKNIFYEKDGQIHKYPGGFSSEEKMQDVIQQIVGRHNRVVNQSSPIVDTRLADGSRVNIVLSPISIDGSSISIRKFPEHPMEMRQLIRIHSLSEEVAQVLKILVKARYNIFISGGTGSGKTTFLNALSQYIPDDERIITIEDSAELQLLDAQNLVRLETRNANLDGVQEISVRDLIRSALRMRPDRIIVGECRGGETLDMLAAMNTGHDGSLSTGHANSPRDMLSRLETMVIMGKDLPLPAIRSQIASGIDIIVQLGRLRDRSRKVLEIVELNGVKDGEVQTNTLYKFQEEAQVKAGSMEELERMRHQKVQGALVRVGKLMHREKLQAAGLEGVLADGL